MRVMRSRYASSMIRQFRDISGPLRLPKFGGSICTSTLIKICHQGIIDLMIFS